MKKIITGALQKEMFKFLKPKCKYRERHKGHKNVCLWEGDKYISWSELNCCPKECHVIRDVEKTIFQCVTEAEKQKLKIRDIPRG